MHDPNFFLSSTNNKAQIANKKRKNPRYKGFDYSNDGYYFVTICTDNKRCLFGEVLTSKVSLNHLGNIVENNIKVMNELFGVRVTSHKVMPNHLHMLIQIANHDNQTKWKLSDLIVRLKSKVMVEYSRTTDKSGFKGKIWQRNYWDYIVRKQEELITITEYIERNAEFWDLERENPGNEYHNIE